MRIFGWDLPVSRVGGEGEGRQKTQPDCDSSSCPPGLAAAADFLLFSLVSLIQRTLARTSNTKYLSEAGTLRCNT